MSKKLPKYSGRDKKENTDNILFDKHTIKTNSKLEVPKLEDEQPLKTKKEDLFQKIKTLFELKKPSDNNIKSTNNDSKTFHESIKQIEKLFKSSFSSKGNETNTKVVREIPVSFTNNYASTPRDKKFISVMNSYIGKNPSVVNNTLISSISENKSNISSNKTNQETLNDGHNVSYDNTKSNIFNTDKKKSIISNNSRSLLEKINNYISNKRNSNSTNSPITQTTKTNQYDYLNSNVNSSDTRNYPQVNNSNSNVSDIQNTQKTNLNTSDSQSIQTNNLNLSDIQNIKNNSSSPSEIENNENMKSNALNYLISSDSSVNKQNTQNTVNQGSDTSNNLNYVNSKINLLTNKSNRTKNSNSFNYLDDNSREIKISKNFKSNDKILNLINNNSQKQKKSSFVSSLNPLQKTLVPVNSSNYAQSNIKLFGGINSNQKNVQTNSSKFVHQNSNNSKKYDLIDSDTNHEINSSNNDQRTNNLMNTISNVSNSNFEQKTFSPTSKPRLFQQTASSNFIKTENYPTVYKNKAVNPRFIFSKSISTSSVEKQPYFFRENNVNYISEPSENKNERNVIPSFYAGGGLNVKGTHKGSTVILKAGERGKSEKISVTPNKENTMSSSADTIQEMAMQDRATENRKNEEQKQKDAEQDAGGGSYNTTNVNSISVTKKITTFEKVAIETFMIPNWRRAFA